MPGPNFAAIAKDYARYRPELPDELMDHLRRQKIVERGQKVLDLCTGTGRMARALAREGCQVIGIDKEPGMIAAASEKPKNQEPAIEYLVANAERTDFASNTFDVVAAANCWDWLNARAVLTEAERVCRPDATLMIVSVDWLPLPGNAVELSEGLIADYNGSWHKRGGGGQHPNWLNDLRCAGLRGVESMSFDLNVELSHETWRGILRSSSAVGGSMPDNKVIRFDARVAGLLEENFPQPLLSLPCCVWVAWAHFRTAAPLKS